MIKELKIAKFYKDGKWTTGWVVVSVETTEVIEKWCSNPGCMIKFTTTEVIE